MTSHDMRAFELDPSVPSVRRAVEDHIERMIAMLDTFDGDPDVEPTLGVPNEARLDDFDWQEYDDRERDDSDLEPNGDELDASYPNDRSAVSSAWNEDDEDADPAGGDIQDEPHDGEERENDPAECGIADADALNLFYGGNGIPCIDRENNCVYRRPASMDDGKGFDKSGVDAAIEQLQTAQPKRQDFEEAASDLGWLFLDVGLPRSTNVLSFSRRHENSGLGDAR